MKQSRYPPGWDEARVRRVIARYESQTEDEAVAEDESAAEQPDQTIVSVPRELVPRVRELIAKREARTGRAALRRRRAKTTRRVG